ncbi:MAG TPA: hypothetical protein DEH78_31195 [Solibacterales bacterium]|nr:hypothetical protein [Bryobacterales bacterium]
MAIVSVLTQEFAHAVADACSKARSTALEMGHLVVYRETDGGCVAVYPSGRRFEVRFDPTRPRESHLMVLREIASNVA